VSTYDGEIAPRDATLGEATRDEEERRRRWRRTTIVVVALIVLKIVCCVVLWFQLSSVIDSIERISVDRRAAQKLDQTQAQIKRLEKRLDRASQ
jgi:cell division protein FtsB